MASNLENLKEVVVDICKEYGKDRTRLMDVVENVQKKFNRVSNEAMDIIASELSAHRVEVEGVVSFYAFLSEEKCGKIIIRVCDDIIDKFANELKNAGYISKYRFTIKKIAFYSKIEVME